MNNLNYIYDNQDSKEFFPGDIYGDLLLTEDTFKMEIDEKRGSLTVNFGSIQTSDFYIVYYESESKFNVILNNPITLFGHEFETFYVYPSSIEGSLYIYLNDYAIMYFSKEIIDDEPKVTPESVLLDYLDSLELEGGQIKIDGEVVYFACTINNFTSIQELCKASVSVAPEYLLVVEEPTEATLQDGEECVYSYLITDDYSVAVEVLTYWYEGQTVLQVLAYYL